MNNSWDESPSYSDTYWSIASYLVEYLGVHVGEADEGEDAGGEGGVPDLGERVPEDVCGVSPSLRHVYLICTIGVVEGHLIKVIANCKDILW